MEGIRTVGWWGNKRGNRADTWLPLHSAANQPKPYSRFQVVLAALYSSNLSITSELGSGKESK